LFCSLAGAGAFTPFFCASFLCSIDFTSVRINYYTNYMVSFSNYFLFCSLAGAGAFTPFFCASFLCSIDFTSVRDKYRFTTDIRID
ncbi:MAG: hypothetical protein KK926_08475, partial [Methanomethylovorans sp.]|nr:hypothetical protein [Methanomethylovorans sp.]